MRVSCQPNLVHRRNPIVTISDEARDKLEDPDAQKWLRRYVAYPVCTYADKGARRTAGFCPSQTIR